MSLPDLFKSLNIPFQTAGHRHVRAGWIGTDCPLCSPGWSKYRLGFEVGSGRVSCWVCGKVNPVQALALLGRISEGEAYRLWKDVPKRQTWVPPVATAGTLRTPPASDLLPAHTDYLQRRGFDPAVICKVWGVQAIGMAERLPWSLLIPIFDPYGRAVSWTTRSIGNENERRYSSAKPDEEIYPHKEILYGAHLARHSIVIVEGPLDVWALGPGAVGTCGVQFSEYQVGEMIKFPRRAVCFDAEPDAQKKAAKLCRQLSAFPGETVNIVLETGKDAAESAESEREEIRREFLDRF